MTASAVYTQTQPHIPHSVHEVVGPLLQQYAHLASTGRGGYGPADPASHRRRQLHSFTAPPTRGSGRGRGLPGRGGHVYREASAMIHHLLKNYRLSHKYTDIFVEAGYSNTNGGKGLGKGGAKRHRKKFRGSIQGVTKPTIRRLARRGGVMRISGFMYVETRAARGVLKAFLGNVVRGTIKPQLARELEIWKRLRSCHTSNPNRSTKSSDDRMNPSSRQPPHTQRTSPPNANDNNKTSDPQNLGTTIPQHNDAGLPTPYTTTDPNATDIHEETKSSFPASQVGDHHPKTAAGQFAPQTDMTQHLPHGDSKANADEDSKMEHPPSTGQNRSKRASTSPPTNIPKGQFWCHKHMRCYSNKYRYRHTNCRGAEISVKYKRTKQVKAPKPVCAREGCDRISYRAHGGIEHLCATHYEKARKRAPRKKKAGHNRGECKYCSKKVYNKYTHQKHCPKNPNKTRKT